MSNKLYSVINILGLSLGLAVCLLITLYVKDELSYDQFQSRKHEIYRLVSDEISPSGEINRIGISGMVQGATFKGQVPEIENMVRIQGERFNIKHNDEIYVQEASKVDSSFFSVFDAKFVEGTPFKALSDPQSIVISEEVAQRFFGKNKALGKTLAIDYDNRFQNFTITGVTRKMPVNSSIQIELLMPLHRDKQSDNQWINFFMNTFFTIKPGTSIAAVEQKFAKIYAADAREQIIQAQKEWNYKSQLVWKLQPFLDMHLSREYQAQNGIKNSGNKLFSYFLSGIALFILLIACINFVNIAISRSMKRAKEIGVRKVVGGQRKQLIIQFLTESALLSFLAFMLAIILVVLALPTFNNLSDKELSFRYLFDVKLVLLYMGIFLGTALLAGAYPALVLSGFKPVETLYGRFRFGGKNILQKSLTVLQFGLATFFILLTIVQFKQVNLFMNQNLGYDDKNIMIINVGGSDHSKANVFMNDILKNPNIKKTAPRQQGFWFTLSTVNGDKQMNHAMELVDDRFIDLMGLKIAQGRNFSPDFPSDSVSSVIVNEAFVKEAGWKTPLGQTLAFNNKKNYQVVGVIKDYHFASLYEKVRPQVLLADPSQGGYGAFYIRLTGQNIPETMDYIKAKFKELMPTKPYEYEFLSETNAKNYEKEVKMKQIIGWSAWITIFISCIGLFGLSALSTEKRFKEIGVRKVLGASVNSIVGLLSLDFLKLILIAFVISAPIEYYVAEQLLSNYPYRITQGVDMFLITVGGLIIVGLFTVSYQAVKAALMNPVKSLKSE
jgi:putative ABC transport system permease protein